MVELILIVAAAVVLLLVVALLRTLRPRRVFILQYQRGLLFRRGLLLRVLEPGAYWTSTSSTITPVDTRLQILNVPGQEILTADGITLKISLAGEYRVINPERFITTSISAPNSLYLYAQAALRSVTADQTLEAMLSLRPALNAQIRDLLTPDAAKLGLEVSNLQLRDLMLTGELKRAFAAAASAQKDGLAALERARSETATLRALANAARLMQEHPSLLQLRAIQAAESSRNSTVVLNTVRDGAPALPPS